MEISSNPNDFKTKYLHSQSTNIDTKFIQEFEDIFNNNMLNTNKDNEINIIITDPNFIKVYIKTMSVDPPSLSTTFNDNVLEYILPKINYKDLMNAILDCNIVNDNIKDFISVY